MRTPVAVLSALAIVTTVSPVMAADGPTVSPSSSASSTSTASPSTSPTSTTSPSTSPSTSPTSTTSPTTSATAGPYGIPMNQNIREDAWCQLLIPNKKGDAAEADSIMDDNIVDLGQYGYYRLSANPNWKPQSTLDGSGNTHINGLYWAAPLLYTGARRGDQAMTQRFFDLIDDWLGKHRKKKTRTWSVTQPIVAGERLWTLTCASDISGGAKFTKATRKEANRQLKDFKLSAGTNNTALHSQGSALAAFCYLGDTAKRDQAAANLRRLADYLVLPDGSDREGSPWYAYYTLRLMANLAPVFSRCGVAYDSLYAATQRLEHYLATAVDPDFHLAMIGDTHRAQLAPKWFPVGSEARWAATMGTEGQPPAALYEAFAGGYVFARNSWTDVGDHRPTFYSVRLSRPYVTAHTHSDLGSVTFNSHGAEFLGDPGPYRYDNSAIRDYIVSRAAHSVVRITPKPKKKPAKRKAGTLGLRALTTASAARPSSVIVADEGAYDRTCLKDRSYSTAVITRCVYYDSGVDALVVVDTINARKRLRADQRWQVPGGVSVSAEADGAVLTAPQAQARVLFTGGGTVKTYRPGSTRKDGWFTGGYGELVKGTTLQRGQLIPKGQKRTWVTVVAAGANAPEIAVADGVVSVTRGQTETFTLP